MNFANIVHTLFRLTQARKHIKSIDQQLQKIPYEELIKQPYEYKIVNAPIKVIVKSYFWASRLIRKDNCLPRSIALFQYLKAAGFEVEHKFGVNKKDNMLAAHAWIEYQGEPLNEPSNLKDRFKELKRP